MMHQKIIARRYAKGLMLAAKEGDLDQLLNDLSAYKEILIEDDSQLSRLLQDPAFSPMERKAVINRLNKTYGMGDLFDHFLLLLVEKDRAMLLPFIHDAFVKLLDQQKGRIRAVIKSATPIDPARLKEIESILKAMSRKDVVSKTLLEPELLGGIRVEMDGTIFDGSAQAKLNALQRAFV